MIFDSFTAPLRGPVGAPPGGGGRLPGPAPPTCLEVHTALTSRDIAVTPPLRAARNAMGACARHRADSGGRRDHRIGHGQVCGRDPGGRQSVTGSSKAAPFSMAASAGALSGFSGADGDMEYVLMVTARSVAVVGGYCGSRLGT